jgi:hypothetical protein
MWFDLTGDERLTQCASEGCFGQPTFRLEADGVGSNYCSGCKAKIDWALVPKPDQITASVDDIPDEKLLERAVRGARSSLCRKGEKHRRWVAVMETFGLGSTYSHQLCRRFGLDPDDEVWR